MKASAQPDMANVKEIYATGQFFFKSEQGNVQNFPVMVQAECYPEYPSHIRLSIRGAGSGDVIKNLYQVIMMYLSS